MAYMNKNTLSVLQIAGLIIQAITLILVLVLFFILSARMTAIEQKQAVIERHMDVLRDTQINIQPLRIYLGQ